MRFTFIDLEPIEYEVLTDILAEDCIHYATSTGPDYDNYVMKAGYNVTVNLSLEQLNFIKYLYNKKVKLYKDFKKMYDLPVYTDEKCGKGTTTISINSYWAPTSEPIHEELYTPRVKYYVKDGEVYRETDSNEES